MMGFTFCALAESFSWSHLRCEATRKAILNGAVFCSLYLSLPDFQRLSSTSKLPPRTSASKEAHTLTKSSADWPRQLFFAVVFKS